MGKCYASGEVSRRPNHLLAATSNVLCHHALVFFVVALHRLDLLGDNVYPVIYLPHRDVQRTEEVRMHRVSA